MKKISIIIFAILVILPFYSFNNSYLKDKNIYQKNDAPQTQNNESTIDNSNIEKNNSIQSTSENENSTSDKIESHFINEKISDFENSNITPIDEPFYKNTITNLTSDLDKILSMPIIERNNFSFKNLDAIDITHIYENSEYIPHQTQESLNDIIVDIKPSLDKNEKETFDISKENYKEQNKTPEKDIVVLEEKKPNLDLILIEDLNADKSSFFNFNENLSNVSGVVESNLICFNDLPLNKDAELQKISLDNEFKNIEPYKKSTKPDLKDNKVATKPKIKLSEIIVSNNKYTKSNFIKKRLKIKSGDEINKRKLQEHLDFINLNPFRKVELILDPLDEINYNIDVLCYDRFFLRPYIGTDNTGLKNLDTNRIYTGINWNNPLWIDSILSYQYLTSYNFEKFQAHSGYWTIYLPWENVLNLFGSFAYIAVDHMIPYIFKNNGSGLETSIRYKICLPIIGSLTHDLLLGFDFKRTDTNLLFSRFRALHDEFVNLTQFLISYSLNWNNNFYRSKILLELYFSPGEMVIDEENERYENFRRFAKNQYIYAKGYFSNLFKLPKDFLISLMLTGQLSNSNLLPSETFAIGGFNTVRGYYEREVNTDSGLIVNFELRSPSISLLPKKRDSLRLIAFIDYGFGSLHQTFPFDDNNFELIGFGPGIRYVINPYLAARLDWGIKAKNLNWWVKSRNEEMLVEPKSLIHFSFNLSY